MKIAVKAWSESKQNILFSGHKQLRTKVENMSKNDSMCEQHV